MGRRDITGVDSNIGSEFKKGMNRYNATTSFRRDGVTYFIEINDMYGTNVIATWWDNSDNGFGYNNYGDVYVNNPFNRMTGSFSPENIDDYIGVNSAYDRNLPASLKKAIINRVKRYIDYDALNDVRRTESIKKGSKSNMKLRISEDVVGNGKTPSLMEIDRIFINNGYKPISPATPDFQFNYRFNGRNFRFRTPKEAWDFIALNDLVDDRSYPEYSDDDDEWLESEYPEFF